MREVTIARLMKQANKDHEGEIRGLERALTLFMEMPLSWRLGWFLFGAKFILKRLHARQAGARD